MCTRPSFKRPRIEASSIHTEQREEKLVRQREQHRAREHCARATVVKVEECPSRQRNESTDGAATSVQETITALYQLCMMALYNYSDNTIHMN